MIGKINSNLGFAGKVYIGGKDNRGKASVAREIESVPSEEARDLIVDNMKALKVELEKATPRKDVYVISFHHNEQNKKFDQDEYMSATISKANKHGERETIARKLVLPEDLLDDESTADRSYSRSFERRCFSVSSDYVDAAKKLFGDLTYSARNYILYGSKESQDGKKGVFQRIMDRLG